MHFFKNVNPLLCTIQLDFFNRSPINAEFNKLFLIEIQNLNILIILTFETAKTI